MFYEKLILFLNLIILTNSSLNPLIPQTKPSRCIADIINSIPSRDFHFLIITINFRKNDNLFYVNSAISEICNSKNVHGPKSYTVISTSDWTSAKCIKKRQIDVYIFFIKENENFAALLTNLKILCSWNPVAKFFILIRHLETVRRQNNIFYQLFRKLIFNVIVVEISSLEQNLITVNMFFFVL